MKTCMSRETLPQHRLYYPEYYPGHCKSDYNIECLGNEEHLQGCPVLFAEYVLEPRLKADAYESHTEQCVLEALGNCPYLFCSCSVHTEAEHQGSKDKPYDKFRETLPYYPCGRLFRVILALV